MAAEVPLLRADAIELARAAEALKRGAMLVVFACERRADRAARAELARAMGEEYVVVDAVLHEADAVAPRLREHGAPSERTVVRLVLDHGADVLGALNLHREKLRQPGVRFALWVAGRDGYRELVRRAPDAFSFRDAVAIVQGDEPPPPPADAREPDALRAARARVLRVGTKDEDARATAWSELIEELFGHDFGDAAREAARLIDWAEALPSRSDAVRRALARALCYRNPNVDRRLVRQRADVLSALSLLGGLASPADTSLRVLLETNVPAPPGYGRDWPMLERAQTDASSPLDGARAARARVLTLLARDAVRGACAPPHVASSGAWNRAMRARDDADRWVAAGVWTEARQATHEVASLTMPKTRGLRGVARLREASVTLSMGELDACRRITQELEDDRGADLAIRAGAQRIDALARAAAGDVEAALAQLRAVARAALDGDLPTEGLDALASLARLVRHAHAAGAVDDAARDASHGELAEGLARCVAVAGDDPPWFPVLAACLRARHLGADAQRLAEAISLAEGALTTAERGAAILAPAAGQLLARLLRRAGEPRGAAELCERLEPLAREHRVMRDVVGLRAARLVAGATAGGGDVSALVDSLRGALDESEAAPLIVKVSRQVGAELARLGRADLAAPFVESALAQAEEMPWPEEQGRCLEALGRPEEAAAHYERWGLILRREILARGAQAPRPT